MEQAYVSHFFSIGWRDVQKMPFGEFVRLAKCASMIAARERMVGINVANFVHLKESDKTKFHSGLARSATEFLETKVKDYREVLANIARSLSGR